MKIVPSIEKESPDEIRRFQESKVRELLMHVAQHSPYYQKIFSATGVDVSAFKGLDDLSLFPTTSKDEFHNHNWEFLAVPSSRIVEYTSTSGTLGNPVTIALTENDLQRLAYNECISFTCADGTPDDLFQLMLTLDRQFMAGMAYYEGIRKLGAGLIRVGPGLPSMQWDIIHRLKPTALVAVPSFLIKLIEYAHAQGINLAASSVKKVICIGEALRTSDLQLNILGTRIKDAWDVALYGTYASTEMQTAFTECEHGRGGHHHPELIYVEILDDAGEPVPMGTPGEITITTLGVEGMPLLRYKTGDIAVAYQDSCRCGRNTLRLGPVLGRKQQMIKLKGTTVYPPGVFDALNEVGDVIDYVVEVVSGRLGTDELRLHLLVKESAQQATIERLKEVFKARLRVAPTIMFVTQAEIDKLQLIGKSRKPKRFIDSRS
ncbi:AMP-binding protein [Chryseolinea sp. T2]|uniref:phenylacetate--CoA ligase family protein n=1 Tax=Chryseolinea sp. T2 TaxID=3129255 RepID=UPI003076DC30